MKIFKGAVIKKSQEKTATVEVVRVVIHPVYAKRYRVSKKYHVHDESGNVKVGDRVKFSACKPISKTKKWKIVEPSSSKSTTKTSSKSVSNRKKKVKKGNKK